jgi:hypothetical protein
MAIVKLKDVRLAFPNLFKPEAVGGSDTKYYSCAFPIVPGGENDKALDAAVEETAKAKWGPKAAAILKTIKDKGDIGYKPRPLTNGEGDVYDGFEGMYSVNATRREDKGPPLVVDRNATPLSANSGRIYGGCWVNATVEIWAQDNQYGKKINVQLRGVQFSRDGDAFGGGAPLSEDEFAALPDDPADELFD